ncbi:NAD(P)/FAD-dependent oxidoreductase [Planomicrobium sp. CPCC 101110]|uniref:phytoene desaturase family protein n=1 Tax=Planomicrobium sp. CPCC 101110 TaxID=2599619 RepID=UPI0011B6E559|nr:NAD(P)/FAD-dependent oxidoreductase [Planomicrobium sp. CPCC 101110]TWT25130.1 FAD-dependent oxidoreductase [Planomicrobium sp. CPCC 101110]
MKQKVLVIGAGIGGLTAGALLAKHGFEVTLLEASSEFGGSAGKFKRKSFLFPAGATLGMGLEPGGIHERVFRYLEKPMPLKPLETVMEMVHPGKTFVFLRDRDHHISQIFRYFPEHEKSLRDFYQEIYKTAFLVRTLMGPLPALPPANIKEWTGLLRSLRLKHGRLLPLFNKTLGQRLKVHRLDGLAPFRKMLDGLLIDSMQTDSEHVSFLLAAVALDIYHEGAYYVPGGLYQFAELMAESIQENGGMLKKRRTITKLEQNGSQWLATDQRGNSYEATDVVLNVPIQQFSSLMAPDLIAGLKKPLRTGMQTPTWTTLTLYIAVDANKLLAPLPPFRQISTGSGDSLTEGEHFFMSASRIGDLLRAPEGYQTVTVSTHSKAQLWDTKEKYDAMREILTNRMLLAIEQVIPYFRDAIVHLETGAPKGWERYTGRPNGYVGGFPQTLDNALFRSISHHSGLPGLYVCGDHIFPGGGTIGAAASGIHAARSVSGNRLV